MENSISFLSNLGDLNNFSTPHGGQDVNLCGHMFRVGKGRQSFGGHPF